MLQSRASFVMGIHVLLKVNVSVDIEVGYIRLVREIENKMLEKKNLLISLVLGVFLITTLMILYGNYQLDGNSNSDVGSSTTTTTSVTTGQSIHKSKKQKSKPTPPPKPPLVTFMVLTADDFKETRTKAIRESWAPRALAMGWRIFYYSETDQGSPHDTIATNETDKSSYGNDKKQWMAWDHMESVENPSPFYMKVDDDAYVFVDRLKRTLEGLDPSGIKMYGRCDDFFWEPKPFCDGGSGIILTREALQAMVRWHNEGKCKDTGHNDLSTSWCMVDNGVKLTYIPGLHGDPPNDWKELANDVTWHHLNPDDLRRIDRLFYD
ncbi:hypothetical protein PPL_12568 [Heterostelium album PN500]|uniref:N-acetylgalactosaminide beta-1,3-galactosyltransferase n=1 Tax=Heterostelium pallidum (strain ATCC 26659 / Pp 5 / PN500) TaxID=670386 RepID=D3BMZ4_HETP5|nr:hypothetical protein PPL_12568 [Heterostelium album PN500]EFA77356.1 hypothetical protein PPL_12568 [Heterostelium album PN500]|eukprot:XP_020429485.1 hypothetical protein PPL_12568 [Heterostelium album PN500]